MAAVLRRPGVAGLSGLPLWSSGMSSRLSQGRLGIARGSHGGPHGSRGVFDQDQNFIEPISGPDLCAEVHSSPQGVAGDIVEPKLEVAGGACGQGHADTKASVRSAVQPEKKGAACAAPLCTV